MSSNQNLHSMTKLTEFARDFEEEPDSLFGRFVNKIQNVYNQSYNTVNDISSINPPQSPASPTTTKSIFYADSNIQSDISTNVMRDTPSSRINSNVLYQPKSGSGIDRESSSTTTDYNTSMEIPVSLAVEAHEGRTMINVLKRMRTMMASKNNDLRNYKDTDLQRFWMPDSKAKECYDCTQKFSTFRRKHHCRLCGQIFCSKCCNQVVPGKIIMCSGDLKVCNYCSKIVLSYLRSPNITKDLNSDLQALQQDLSSKLETNSDIEQTNLIKEQTASLERKISVGYQEERFAAHQSPIGLTLDDRKNILQQSNSLITLHEEMSNVLPAQNCGVDLIDFLNVNHKSSNKVQAIAILNAMLDAGFIQPIVNDSEETAFNETLHYRFVSVLPRQCLEAINFMEINQAEETLSPQYEQFGIEPHPPKSLNTSSNLKTARDMELENSMHSTTSKLLESYCDHEEQLLTQMLRGFQLDLQWAKVLTPLCCGVANHFKPEYCTNELMDIRNYVNFKKVSGGKRVESKIVGGVVFSKNVAHKAMATRVEHPDILLLQCPIVYQRIEGKFVSISTVMLQEKEYLRNVCARIMSFNPNVVLVHKNVAGVAQDILRSNGITLVLDVKLSVMDRLARTLQCDVLTSIEGSISLPKLGKCDAFYIRNYNDGMGDAKTLMFFEKLQSPRVFTCLLRGGSTKELAKVKKIASFLVYARYNWRLEMSFLLDEFAEPLAPKPPIFDSKETSPADENTNISDINRDSNLQDNQKDEEVAQLRLGTTLYSHKQRPTLVERKSEEKILTTATDVSADFTDPLRSADRHILPDNSQNLQLAVEHRYDNRFRSALSSTILSVSPFLTFPLPYLETEQGRKCPLRALFPAELYFSKLWSNVNETSSTHSNFTANYDRLESLEINSTGLDQLDMNPSHEFLKINITTPIDNREIQTLLAEFRAYGGRYPKKPSLFKLLKGGRESKNPVLQKLQDDNVYKDALNITNHQRLPVLFCSFFFNPKGASSFCAPPTLLDMEFYAQQDIMLGQFLQRYCCRLSSICTRCNLPMLGHTRRYVHSMGCVKVFLSEDNTISDLNSIYFTAWCSICNEVTPSVPLSETTKCLSLAKYLELRFHGHAYKKRSVTKESGAKTHCSHSLHRDYVHQFSYRSVAAKFQYTPLETWEIALPLLTLNLHPTEPFHRFLVLEEVKNFSMKGHEMYTRIHERIADLATEDESSAFISCLKTTLSKDQFTFKQHVEIVQTLLTENKASSYDINDALVMSKRVLAESIEQWVPRLLDITNAQKIAAKQGHDSGHVSIDPGTICTEDLCSEQSDISPTTSQTCNSQRFAVNEDNIEPISHTHETTIDSHFVMPAADKKTIKSIITQLLPSTGPVNPLQSPFSNLEHYTLPLGAFPLVVHDHDFSSIIAYSLISQKYKRLLSSLATKQQNASDATSISSSSGVNVNPSPHVKRKSQESSYEDDENGKDNTTPPLSVPSSYNDEDRSKSKNNNSHIEINFNDGNTQFTCKIYFAKEFDLMRAKTIKPPKLDKSLYREIEQSKKREELKVSQSQTGPEIELVRKPSDAAQNCATSNDFKWEGNTNINKDDNSHTHIDVTEECRYYFARSLSSSIQWEAKGGKSGSRFCKTSDDRFVLKEMTKSDISSFDNFAPNYFDYIGKCQQQNQPTLLAKIFGVFKITIKKKDSFVEKSLLVMENLFYECDIKDKFDLKGSERNRLVDPMNQQQGDIVLLDENFVQMSWLKPLYILTHSKVVLKDAINRDACFLEKNQVMDYSLLVGLDKKNDVLVLGIIDYIRTFTFDKKVESFVKQTGILGGMGKLPTIISPERYRLRFADAMNRYFYTVPDRWEGLSKI